MRPLRGQALRWTHWFPAFCCWAGAWQTEKSQAGLLLVAPLFLLALLAQTRRSRMTALIALAAAVCWHLPGPNVVLRDLPNGIVVADVEVITTRVERTDDDTRSEHALVRIRRAKRLTDNQPLARSAQLWVRDLSCAPGTHMRLLLDVHPWPSRRNVLQPFEWPRRAQGHARIVGKPARVRTGAWKRRIDNLRRWLRDALHRDLDADTAAFVAALTLGDQGLIARSDAERVRRSGAAHVLAVSGLHVGVVSLIALWLIRRIALGLGSLWHRGHTWDLRRLSHGVAIPLVLVHGVIAGGSPSALRASWMVAGAHFALILGFRPCAQGALMALPLLASAYDDALLRRPAFALSYLACLVLVHTSKPPLLRSARRLRRWRLRIQQAASISLRITMATAPVALCCFGELAWVGAISNVLFVPLSSLVLVPSAYLQLLISALGLGTHTAELSAALRDLLFCLCSIAETVPPIEISPMTAHEVVAISALSAAFFVTRHLQWAMLVCFGIAASWSPVSAKLSPYLAPELEVRVLDVGQGDATLIRHRSRFLMVDMGRTVHFGDNAQNAVRGDAVVHSLRAQRIQRLELLIISHAHPDHYLSWQGVFEHIDISELWLPTYAHPHESSHFRSLVERARVRGTRVRLASELCAQAQRRVGLDFDVLAPCHGPIALDSLNDASFVVRLRHQSRSILFTGDIEKAAETRLLNARAPLHADIVKVPHHGSLTSSGPKFVDAVSAHLSLISAGAANRFGHPHREVIARWRKTSCVLVTSQHGAITLYSDGARWRLREPSHRAQCKSQAAAFFPRASWSP